MGLIEVLRCALEIWGLDIGYQIIDSGSFIKSTRVRLPTFQSAGVYF